MPPLGQLIRTVRHLRPGQVAAQVRHRVRQKLESPARLLRCEPPAFPGLRWTPPTRVLPPAPVDENPTDQLLAGTFTFANQPREVGWPPDWSAEAPRLWQYHLHYHDVLWSLGTERAAELVLDWIGRHPPARGATGWEPYPIAMRLQNWLLVCFGRDAARWAMNEPEREKLWASVWRQAEWLATHLEWHLRGNHLMEDAVALAMVGSAFEGLDAQRWRDLGLRLVREQVAEQVLPDGMHFERSPMYHLRMTHALAVLCHAGVKDDVLDLLPVVGRMTEAVRRVTAPDGDVALFNDAMLGQYPRAAEVLGYAQRVLEASGQPSAPALAGAVRLPDAGYYGWRDDIHGLLFDAGPVGPDHQPGHAHADVFSFELSRGGRRVIVDAGVHDYEVSPMRRYVRSTLAHNTVAVAGESQAELWGAFRVGRRPRVRGVSFEHDDAGFRLVGEHDGYCHLPGSPTHRREARWLASGVLMVRDEVAGGRAVETASRLRLAPGLSFEPDGTARWRIAGLDDDAWVAVTPAADAAIEDGWYCPRLYTRLPVRVLVLRAVGPRVRTGYVLAFGAMPGPFDWDAGVEVGGRRQDFSR